MHRNNHRRSRQPQVLGTELLTQVIGGGKVVIAPKEPIIKSGGITISKGDMPAPPPPPKE